MSVVDEDRRRRDQWKRANRISGYDRSGAGCSSDLNCPCPACREFGAMRAEAYRQHYLNKVEDWQLCWQIAGWTFDGNAPTPFAEPSSARVNLPRLPPAPPRNGNWVIDRFAELFTTTDESTGEVAADVAASGPKLEIDL